MRQDSSYISNSKTKKYFPHKAIISIVIVVIAVGAVLSYAGKKYENAAAYNTVNYFTKSRYEEFDVLKENSVDMVFLGSSHAYCTFDPENFDEHLGTLSWQLGTPLQTSDTTYFSMLKVLEKQTPKVVVAEVYWDMLDDGFLIEQAKSFFRVLNNEELEKKYIREVFPMGEKVKYNIKPIRYQADFFALLSNNFDTVLKEKFGVYKPAGEEISGEEYYRSKGYVYCDYVMPENEYDKTNQFKGFDGHGWEMNKNKEKYLEKLAKLCAEKDIKLIFVTAPIAPVSMDYIKNYEDIHGQIKEFSEKLGVPYIDYNYINYTEKILGNEYFRDDAHLNDEGVKVIDEMFRGYLVENGYFTLEYNELYGN